MIKIETATIKDIPTIQKISNIVWPITFGEILSKEQIEYMMEMMYSDESLTKQMTNDDHHYILAKENEEYIGYLSYQTNIDNRYCKIHKLYVLPTGQGKGIGRKFIEYVKQIAITEKDQYLRLHVNRYNHALEFYKHLGFSVAFTEDIDIGNNFLMEDYVLEMKISETHIQ